MPKELFCMMQHLCIMAAMLCCSVAHIHAIQLQDHEIEESEWDDSTYTFIMESRQRMQQIRSTLNRPTVGLVLSGGGAMGASEVGAIKYIEELGIPIDLVCGTSIGGLLGGLYAIGYNAEELQQIFTSQDWNKILSDNVNNQNVPYHIQEYDAKALYSIKLGKNQELSESQALPSGLIYGFNVNNLFSSLTVGYGGDISFSDLPIPYACVSADLVSCKAYNWVNGSISTAMRSTMSIPGLFAPVKTDDMILVDGGVRNNFPADIAKAMGADYIIGIDLHDARATYKDVTHLGNVVSQLIAMFSRDAYDDNLELANVVIKPKLDGFSMLSFNSKAVDNLVAIGYDAAKEKENELLALRKVLGSCISSRKGADAINIAKQPVKIQSIVFEGLNRDESLMMLDIIVVDTTKTYGRNELEDIIGSLQGTGYFAEIKYTLEGKSEPYNLVFECIKAPTHKFGFGLRGDTEEGVSAFLNYGINANTMLGSKLELEAKINQNMKAMLKYSYVSNALPTLNMEVSFANTNMKLGSIESDNVFNLHYWSHNESLYLSFENRSTLQFRCGLENYWIKFLEADILSFLMKEKQTEDYIGIFADGHYYTLNDHYYPTKGTSIGMEGRYEFAQPFYEIGFAPLWHIVLKYKSVLPIGPKAALIPSVNAVANSCNIDVSNEDDLLIPLSSLNYLGGAIDKREHRNQIAFFGVHRASMAEDYLLTGTLEMRYNFANKWYASLLCGYYTGNNTIDKFFDKKDSGSSLYAFGTELSYRSKLGPMRFNLHWNSFSTWGAYLSIGYDF